MTAAKNTAKDVGVRQLDSGRWQARYRANGVLHQATSVEGVPFANKTDAKRWRAQQIADVQRGQHVAPGDRTTVAEFATQWIEARPIRASTAKRYNGMVAAHLRGTPLGDMRLVQVRQMHVQGWVTSRSVRLSPSTLSRVYGFIQSLMKAAQAHRIIGWSPCDGVILPQAVKPRRRLVTAEQIDAIETEVPDRYKVLVRLLATCGLRVGEALALRPEDIDRATGVLSVTRTLDQKARSVGPVKFLSTSHREIDLPRFLLTALAAHKLAYPHSATDLPPEVSGLLFTSAHGRPLRYDSFAYAVFRPAVERAGVPGVTPHDLRHFAGSAMLADGVPPVTIASILGHTLQTFETVYARAMPSGRDLAAASMANRARGGTRVACDLVREDD